MQLHFIIYFVRPTYYHVLFSPPDELFNRFRPDPVFMRATMTDPFCPDPVFIHA